MTERWLHERGRRRRGCERGGTEVWLESELTASELIQPQSSKKRECSSVIFLTERVIGGGRQREEWKALTERMRDGGSWSGTTIAGCSSGCRRSDRERSEEHTAALWNQLQAAHSWRLHTGVTFCFFHFFLLALIEANNPHNTRELPFIEAGAF